MCVYICVTSSNEQDANLPKQHRSAIQEEDGRSFDATLQA